MKSEKGEKSPTISGFYLNLHVVDLITFGSK